MAKFFYTDANGHRQGPINDQQLRTLAREGIITPETPLETESGHRGTAGQIQGLEFNNVPPIIPRPDQTAQAARILTQQAKESSKSWLLWLFDFGFNDIRFYSVFLWFYRIFYALSVIFSIAFGIVITLATGFWYASNIDWSIITLPFIWLAIWFCIILSIFLTRLTYEYCIMLVRWIHITTKAAQLYIENSKNNND